MGLFSGKITEDDEIKMFTKRNVRGLIKAASYHEDDSKTRNGA
jgi:hypothetical protein